MNTRNIRISLEQAREWFKGDNETLKKLALTAYTEEELQPYSYNEIAYKVLFETATCCVCLDCPAQEEKTIKALNKLRIIAAFFNKGWRKDTENTGYFIAPVSAPRPSTIVKYGWRVAKHATVKHPEIIYFKDVKAASIALDIAYTEGWLNDLK